MRIIKLVVIVFIAAIVLSYLSAVALSMAWNNVMPYLIGWRPLTTMQMWGLMWIVSVFSVLIRGDIIKWRTDNS